MRPLGISVAAAIAVVMTMCAGCAHESAPVGPGDSKAARPSGPTVGTLSQVVRTRGEVPPDYEVAEFSGRPAPQSVWGFGEHSLVQPSQCGALADPVGAAARTAGWSASGPGGIVYVVVAGSPPTLVTLDPALLAECGEWTIASANTTGVTRLVPATSVDGAVTVEMSTTSTTVVEGGTETHSRAQTAMAYLGEYLVFVAVVSDPGASGPVLRQEFAADLLSKTVSALRS